MAVWEFAPRSGPLCVKRLMQRCGCLLLGAGPRKAGGACGSESCTRRAQWEHYQSGSGGMWLRIVQKTRPVGTLPEWIRRRVAQKCAEDAPSGNIARVGRGPCGSALCRRRAQWEHCQSGSGGVWLSIVQKTRPVGTLPEWIRGHVAQNCAESAPSGNITRVG